MSHGPVEDGSMRIGREEYDERRRNRRNSNGANYCDSDGDTLLPLEKLSCSDDIDGQRKLSFIPGSEINIEVLAFYINEILDRNAELQPGHCCNDENVAGYFITSTTVLTEQNILDVRIDSRHWSGEINGARSTRSRVQYVDSQTAQRRLQSGESKPEERNATPRDLGCWYKPASTEISTHQHQPHSIKEMTCHDKAASTGGERSETAQRHHEGQSGRIAVPSTISEARTDFQTGSTEDVGNRRQLTCNDEDYFETAQRPLESHSDEPGALNAACGRAACQPQHSSYPRCRLAPNTTAVATNNVFINQNMAFVGRHASTFKESQAEPTRKKERQNAEGERKKSENGAESLDVARRSRSHSASEEEPTKRDSKTAQQCLKTGRSGPNAGASSSDAAQQPGQTPLDSGAQAARYETPQTLRHPPSPTLRYAAPQPPMRSGLSRRSSSSTLVEETGSVYSVGSDQGYRMPDELEDNLNRFRN